MPLLYAAVMLGLAGAGTIKLLASSTYDVASSIDATGSGALKIAVAIGGTYAGLKYFKVIK